VETENSFKLTPLEKYWILYDVGNSAFIMLVTTIIPIYFNSLAQNAGISSTNYLSYWGYSASICTLIVAFLGPVLGSLADIKNYKKPVFAVCLIVGALGCAALSVPKTWITFLTIFIIAKVGYSASLIFYDSMLTDVTTPKRMDIVSTQGYAWGYIGSCIPFMISLLLVLFSDSIGIPMVLAMTITFFINAVWWLASAIPLLKHYKQLHYLDTPKHLLKDALHNLINTFKDIRKNKNVFFFLLSFFFYIDGVYTIMEMATAYGESLGLDSTGLLLALLVTQLVAFPCALFFARVSKKYKTSELIKICIFAYAGIAAFAIQLDKQWEFWLLAVLVGMFQGGIQALSRSYFAKIIPPKKAGEYFGIYDIFGKGASFMGTTCIAVIAQITGSANAGISILTVIFMIGLFLFYKASKLNKY